MATSRATAAKAKKQPKKNHPKDELFVYDNGDGIRIEIPYIENIPYGVIEDGMDADGEADAVRVLLDGVMDEDARKARRDLTFSEFRELIETWNRESAIQLGEL
ncbi:hypothetical protein [Actinobaculum sp. 352]|uniref:hypothetical protein n=1 Tax=Actinobaculum sp. 352 TaxID=2490946 RepID=UPI000F7E1C9B|nr:hypothetical protein [Actinobaculum sp. 352]RTE50389.1 hypothetical protein EKN07_04115 [Actinobaculum sp. 352]